MRIICMKLFLIWAKSSEGDHIFKFSIYSCAEPFGQFWQSVLGGTYVNLLSIWPSN